MPKTLAIYAIPDVNAQYPEFIHDHNLCIFENGRIIKYLHLERVTGKKYDNTLHKHLYRLLRSEGLLGEHFDMVSVDSVIGRSFICEQGKLRFEANPFDKLGTHEDPGLGYWLNRKTEGFAVRHELAHIFSAVPFYGLFRDNSLLVHFDGGASVGNFSVWLWKDNQLSLLDYGWDLKHLSSLFNANALNFFILGVKRKEHNSLPGKYMGFAGWGQYDARIENWLRENNFFQDIWQDKQHFFASAEKQFGWKNHHFNTQDKFLQDIAATVQVYFTRELLNFFIKWQQKTNTDYLYYTGGSALNLYVNTELWQRKIFKDIFIPPATNDSGLSIGAGAFIEWKKGHEIQQHLPYLNNWELKSGPVIDNNEDIPEIAELLLENKVLGIFNGYGEAGPRALGNRSIIALPDNKALAKIVSQIKKEREWYRPVAPVMLEETAKKVTGLEHLPVMSQYMLTGLKILPQYYSKLKGVIHKDGTSRIQVLFDRRQNPFLWDLLEYLYKKHDIYGLINTSFNAKGKPIVHFEHQAIGQARQMSLDGIIINGKLHKFSV